MKSINIACIVEGYGEVDSLPILLRRIVPTIDPAIVLHIAQPTARVSRSTLIKPQELENAVIRAAQKVEHPGAILILLDADQDCPKSFAPRLLLRAQTARSDMPIALVLANKEYEAWFLAAAESLRGKRGLYETLQPPNDPEAISGAKEWLTKHMNRGHTYKPTVDQAALTSLFDLQAARTCRSFDKLYRDIERLLSEAASGIPAFPPIDDVME